MKTFLTEKHNIPEGATHYRDECDKRHFLWVKIDGDDVTVYIDSEGEFLSANWLKGGKYIGSVKPIPQTNIETPEEKEALDLIDTTPHQYESVASKEVEWVNGELLKFNGEPCIFIGMSEGFPVVKYTNDADSTLSGEIDEIFATDMLSKPETEAERVERERLENGQSLYELVQSLWCTVDSKYTPHPYSSPMVDDKTKEMYARLARAVDYRKES